MTGDLFDEGLQPERTMLAWERTVLALCVASVLAVRLTADELGLVGVLGGLAGLGLSVAAYVSAARRYGLTSRRLVATGTLPSDGRAAALIVGAMLVIGAAAAGYLLANAAW